MEEADSQRFCNSGQARKAEEVRRLSRREDSERTSRHRKRCSGSTAFAGSCSATFWKLTSGATSRCSGTTNDDRDHQDRHWNETRHQYLQPHLCPCGNQVESRGIPGLSCCHSAARISRHKTINDIIWRAMQRAKILAAKEPPGLLRSGNKRPDCVTLIPWKQGKCLSWDVTMPDTNAQSRLKTTATSAGHAAGKSAVSKTQKYQSILQTHLFTPIAIETAGVWNSQAREFITELGKRITTVTGEIKETSYIFQQVSVAIQRGNMLSFIGSFTTDTD